MDRQTTDQQIAVHRLKLRVGLGFRSTVAEIVLLPLGMTVVPPTPCVA
jgi:hypothetical protein